MSPLFIAAIAASLIPQYDIARTCHIDTAVTDDEAAYQSCISDEQAAKEKIAKEWSRYPSTARDACSTDQVPDPDSSYVELMTCFEIEDWKNHLNDVGGIVAGSRPVGGSPFTPEQMGGGMASHPLGGVPGAHF